MNSGRILFYLAVMFCHHSQRLKGIIVIVLVYRVKVVSTTLAHNIYWRKLFKVDLIGISKHEFMLAILFCLNNTLNYVKVRNQWGCLKHPDHWVSTGILMIFYCYNESNNLSGLSLGKTDHVIQNWTMDIRWHLLSNLISVVWFYFEGE